MFTKIIATTFALLAGITVIVVTIGLALLLNSG